ncbi:MAG: D-2-hydroxyacid dehydrogenase family protein [Chloroflexi bacterium]|nr:D-2-hydroxyacid dehydrogenase family protein [Chloroflexota bacterium]
MRVAILDDYQSVALRSADWDAVGADAGVVAFRTHLDDRGALAERLAAFDVVVAMRERTRFDAALFARLPALQLLVTTGMGNTAIDMAAARDHGITVCGTGGLTSPTAELTWGLILALVRNIPAEHAATRAGAWQTSIGSDLRGKTLGVLGLGRLGSHVARVGIAFEMRVVAWSANLTPARAAEVGVELAPSLRALLAAADVASIHLVLSERTRGLIGAPELTLLGPQGYLVNTSRGPIVDEGALVEALRTRAIAGAGLDVFDREPLPAEHPLRGLDNVVLTPHLGYVTRESYAVFYGEAVEDICAFRDGTPLRVLNA